ncbi:MAG: replicative DNA helicase [Clostridia bacterium]|nr:replicative DNA helicase [Clostridia bacterium]
MDYESALAQTSGISDYALPFSPEAEQSILGAILLDPSCLSVVADMIPRPEYFYQVNNKLIYSAMLEMFTLGKAVDFVTVLEYLKSDKEFDDITGKVYLTQLCELVPSLSNVDRYCEIVKDKYDLRMLILASRQTLQDAQDASAETASILDSAEQRIYDIRQGKSMQGIEKISDVIIRTFQHLDELNSDDRDRFRGINTGIGELDRTITGLNRSDLIILAARPGMGKTSFALNIARHAAVVEKRRVAFFSLEMSKEQLASRMLSTEALVGSSKLRTGELSEDEWTRLIEGGDILSKTEIYFDDNSGITVPEMKAKLRRLQNVDLVVIDYLQLMGSAKKIDNRVQEISDITRNLKIMAKELDVPVVALSQLARTSEKRTDHKPVLSDLRDSGSIEQDADIVLFLYRDAYYTDGEGEQSVNKSECIVAKNRHGESRSVPLHWQGEFTRFTAEEYVRNE